MDSPLALYRRYRPETFAEVIGQDHVTEPLRAALASNRVNHAYLFSGPRGCGKTTSARILARALNCEQAPIADPCGECRSCRDLARGGPGSIDVIEIDAASHGGVDDARDLREKAFFAPVHSRYKVYVIDEAHMVTTQGFNALLKLVEEPPPHLRFIFATTEPDKVIPTIRSRTHHYPFRLIPPKLLSGYLQELCDREGVPIEPAAVPLVVRAGAGSARDTLSVLDQLIGGSGPDGVTHALATGLLGYTPDTLLDEVIDAFAAGDGAGVFGVVDKVIEVGQDPRRFTEDLLRRLRDLVIIAAVPDAPATGLLEVAEDQGERLSAQAARFGATELSRAADLVAAGLTEMRGATAPRLLLELICARVLLPAADSTSDGVMARLDRIERRMAMPGGAAIAAEADGAPAPAPRTVRPRLADALPAASTAAPAAPATAPPAERPVERRDPRPVADQPPAVPPRPAAPPSPVGDRPGDRPGEHDGGQALQPTPRPTQPGPAHAEPAPPAGAPADRPGERPGEQAYADAPTTDDGWPTAVVPGAQAAAPPLVSPEPEPAAAPTPSAPAPSAPAPSAPAPSAPAPSGAGSSSGGMTLADVRRLWPEVVEATKSMRRVTWIHLSKNAQVVAFSDGVLTLGFANAGARSSFESGGSIEVVQEATVRTFGFDWRIEAIVDPGAAGGSGGTGGGPTPPRPPQPPAAEPERPSAPAPRPESVTPADGSRQHEEAERPPQAREAGAAPQAERPQRQEPAARPADAARQAHAAAGQRSAAQDGPPPDEPPAWLDDPDDAASPDDPVDDAPDLAGTALLERELGAVVINQIRHD
ncbi:DNA polymerase-3 subunit gamma/tau [Nocardioides zeae]|uniref:DNA-directed DNA polymerase n=1 Tax=Nocardioides zeae TaxID=1457234 RepID=A0AAJ1U7Z2_9ACTN|nr:DNA polymerase III subunit gamma and tau [Nocardioides zeae]MDQ1105827.1 DNA polymerase-3 subunit gamma/tau [Nocardioides zeae]